MKLNARKQPRRGEERNRSRRLWERGRPRYWRRIPVRVALWLAQACRSAEEFRMLGDSAYGILPHPSALRQSPGGWLGIRQRYRGRPRSQGRKIWTRARPAVAGALLAL